MSSLTVSPISAPAPSQLSILYLGWESGTSGHRAQSLSRLGHRVRVLDPRRFLPSGRIVSYWNHHTGAWGFGGFVRSRVLETIGSEEFDLIWIDAGDIICPELVQDLKKHARFVLNYNVDDPFGKRDSHKWRLYLNSVPFYDLLVVVRDCNVDEASRVGCRNVMRVHRSSDEVAHAPRAILPNDWTKWKSEVAFIGTWMPERGPFIARLVERGVPVSIWGDRWSKAQEWATLRAFWRGRGIYDDEGYAMAIQCARVCIGLLSKGNRDLCTQRSFEIPQLGGLLCAERTCEHLALYKEDVEAVFWSDPDECAAKCKRLLTDESWRAAVADNGRLRAIRNATSNEAVMNQIISRVFHSVREGAAVSK